MEEDLIFLTMVASVVSGKLRPGSRGHYEEKWFFRP